MKYAIDGLFHTQQITGIQRYAYEITAELDKLVSKDEIELIVPESTIIDHEYVNIKVVRYGSRSGILWRQTDFCKYVKKNKLMPICMTNATPLLCNEGIAVIHDVSYKANPQFFTSARDRLSALWQRLNYWHVAHSKMKIVTVSEFSKSEICKYYQINSERITVVYNAWQHMNKVNAAEDTFDRYPQISQNDYYFSMCTLAPNKNLKWIIKCAEHNPNQKFAIAGGGKLKRTAEELYGKLPNVFFLGYVSDEDAKTLMANCKSFLFPTLYEGFGIPPLEAIACGAKNIFVSDTPCMREIYGNHSKYIELSSSDYHLNNVDSSLDSKTILNKYSWKTSADILNGLLH